ncbi:hypothetical protein SAICODRAFT_156685 [Saitoella complicata NRRL Y-17804]|uniref:uncharacterized protein n=1 Tax=Saitoella complicata (strain BCRC 22490 / CBS 7301 / JCM 7358 / NBRC 10748 / NRRL Y-17804) TaxID=698492 RepID=UPI000866F19F|nr:uncharacterized protein SAICODRAFT_156685 [Saitoella complicata NRRL Y-17804]ODQ51460.1 hypothetical protein SAICODRAFT_156685 [Saitoella complicata NRRL Y-17804]
MNQDENNDTIPPEYRFVEEWRAVVEEEAIMSHLSTLRFAPESSILVTHTPPNSVAKDPPTSQLALSTLAPLRDHLSERLHNLTKEHARLILSPGPHNSTVAFRRDILITLQDIIAAQGSIRHQYTHEADLRRSQLCAVSEYAEKERKILQAMSESTKDIER